MSTLWSEAARIKQLAERNYPPVSNLQATFRTRGHQQIVYYNGPKDIPLSQYDPKHGTLLLYSVSRIAGHNITEGKP